MNAMGGEGAMESEFKVISIHVAWSWGNNSSLGITLREIKTKNKGELHNNAIRLEMFLNITQRARGKYNNVTIMPCFKLHRNMFLPSLVEIFHFFKPRGWKKWKRKVNSSNNTWRIIFN